MELMTQPRRLPLHDAHAQAGAKFMTFAGWEVPLQYTTIVQEHEAVRTKAGVFDVSHMGKFLIRGRGAFDFLESVISNGLRKIGPGRAIYSVLPNERGGIVDDIIVYEFAPDHFFLIVNAATKEKDFAWLASRLPDQVELKDESEEKTILAVQGPESAAIVSKLFGEDFTQMKPFHFKTLKQFGEEIMIASTGYTGERGFEIINKGSATRAIFDKLLQIGREFGLKPAGFGARDTLRLEAGLLLYGQDMNDETTPVEAGLEWVCDFSKNFTGKANMVAQKESGPARRLTAFEMTGTAVARHGYPIYKGNERVGEVASGTFSPTLKRSIGFAYLPAALSKPESKFEVMIRDKKFEAVAVKSPFYRKARS